VDFKGVICPAEHPPILDRDLFEDVKLVEQRNGYRAVRASLGALLTGRIFDDFGNRMSPSQAARAPRGAATMSPRF
jgi:site-specific DNA recombinase